MKPTDWGGDHTHGENKPTTNKKTKPRNLFFEKEMTIQTKQRRRQYAEGNDGNNGDATTKQQQCTEMTATTETETGRH